jgi:TolA-binding protein
MIVFTLLLNILCNRGLGIISWLIVFIPFILMTYITAILLYTFGLSPTKGKTNPNVKYPIDYPEELLIVRQPYDDTQPQMPPTLQEIHELQLQQQQQLQKQMPPTLQEIHELQLQQLQQQKQMPPTLQEIHELQLQQLQQQKQMPPTLQEIHELQHLEAQQ